EGGDLTIWAWDPTLESVASDFEELHPNVNIELVNAGTGSEQYTALQNAMAAGKGMPDVAQVEYYALSQFILTESLTDLSAYGADDLEGTFTTGPWESATQGGGVYALPTDSGPMALFYNKSVFEKYDIEVPETWEEFAAAAEKIHEADSEVYLTADTGDAGMTTSLIWQTGGRPFQVDGTDVTIDFSGEGTQKFADYWNSLVQDELLAPVTAWSDAWYQGLSDG